jgi:thioredoxin reductase (NADPH)
MEEAIIIGAGPCGLSAAAELKKIHIDPLIIEKGAIVQSIYSYPTYMQFFSTPELLEIGDVPFTTPNDKPSRREALEYYSTVARRKQLRILSYVTVTSVQRYQNHFAVIAEDRFGEKTTMHARHVIVASGYFDHPNILGIPGEKMAKVSHFYREAHPYQGMRVAIVGGNNSAVDAALDLQRSGANVTLIYRGEDYSPGIKAWVRPVFESMVRKGRINMLFQSELKEVRERTIIVERRGERLAIENDFVLALTGFRPDRSLLADIGVIIDSESQAPAFDPETMETNVTGLYIAGVVASGNDANEIFIENGRFHGASIARHIAAKSK